MVVRKLNARKVVNNSGLTPVAKKGMTFFLAFIGAILSAIAWFAVPPQWESVSVEIWQATVLLMVACCVGFGARMLRRRLFWGKQQSLHRTFSLEALFQGITFLNPQLPYPTVENEILLREPSLTAEAITRWFRVRPVSSVVVSLALLGMILTLANYFWLVLIVGLVIAIVLFRETKRPIHPDGQKLRFIFSILAGVLAVWAEGLLIVVAVQKIQPELSAWIIYLFYSLVLTGFELTPFPFALGVLETPQLIAVLFSQTVFPGLYLPLAYRLFRGIPITLLTIFYLPRNKLRLRDLYDSGLPLALALTRRPATGWPRIKRQEGIFLSIVIPAYNEKQRLPAYLPKVIEYIHELDHPCEIILVDDGSTDGTAVYARRMKQRYPEFKVLQLETNSGKGAAVRSGVMAAQGEFILFADADGATPIKEANQLLNEACRGIDIVIGSRCLANKDTTRQRSFLRTLMGAIFYRVTNLLAVPDISDTQCGFKLLHYQAARHIFPLIQENGWAFDVELLFLAQKYGFSIAEVPVNWTAVAGSKINPIRDSLKMLVALWRVRRRNAGLTANLKRFEFEQEERTFTK